MSSRKSPPPSINVQHSNTTSDGRDKGKSRARPISRTPSHNHSSGNHQQNSHQTNSADQGDHDDGDDDQPPTSTLRARNVTGVSMREFPSPPSTPKTGESGMTGVNGMIGSRKLPGVKGTRGGLASPAQQQYPISPSWSNAGRDNGDSPQTSRHQLTFRTDPTIKSCLDTLPLGSKDELKRLFGIA